MPTSSLALRCLAAVLLVCTAASPALAASGPATARLLVTVKKSGYIQTTSLRQGAQHPAAAACSDPATAFAFTIDVAGGNVQNITPDTALPLAMNAQATCSNINGEAELAVGTHDGTAVAGQDYTATAGTLLFNALTSGDTANHPATASLLLHATSSGSGKQFHVVLQGGSYYDTSSNAAGSIAGTTAPIATLNIVGSTTPGEAIVATGIPLDPGVAQSVTNAAMQSCNATSDSDAQAVCDALTAAAAAAESGDAAATQVLVDNVLALAPDELTGIARTAESLAASQQANIAARLVAMRFGGTGSGGVNLAGLSLQGNGGSLPVGSMLEAALVQTFAPLLADEGEEARRTLLGGTRWGLWVNGTLGGGDYEHQGSESAFDFDNWSLTAGMDYRFPWNGYAGLALGRAQTDLDFSLDGGSMKAGINALHLYGGYDLPAGLGLDASASYQWGNYDQMRRQQFYDYTGGQSTLAGYYEATSDSDITQRSASFGASWNFRRNAWLFAPRVQFQFIDTKVDGFAESGSPFDLIVDAQDFTTRSWSAGFYSDYAFATTAGTWRLNLRGTYFLDGGSGDRNLLARFAAGGAPFSVTVREPDRRYATLEPGIAFSRPIGTRTWDFNFGAMKLYGFDSLDRWAIRLDVRVPL